MDEVQGRYKVKNRKFPTKPSTKDSSIIRYHSPYVDTSREKFYLPRKWHHGGNNWQECDVNYEFKKDEMCGMALIKNLRWLGKSNQLMKLVNNDDSSDEFEHDEAKNKEDTSEAAVPSSLVEESTTVVAESERMCWTMNETYEEQCPKWTALSAIGLCTVKTLARC